jgi:hypothetical protein
VAQPKEPIMQILSTPQWMLNQGFSVTFCSRFWSKIEITESCWKWTGYKNRHGYGGINKGNKKMILASRASWMLHNGPIPQGLDVCHHCDNPPCCNPDHLFIGTAQANMRDAASKGRLGRIVYYGERSAHHKLNQYQVNYLREHWNTSQHNTLATELGISYQQAWRIVRRLSWLT